MKTFALILFFAALLADVYIYRSVICTYFKRLPARMAYILFALVTDGAALAVFGLYRSPAGHDVILWFVWVFLFTALPKLLFGAGGFLDFIVSLFTRRRALVFRPIAVAASLAVMVMMICGATAGRTQLRVNEVEICSDRIPEAFDGYSIVQFSDVHIGTMPKPGKRLSRITETINGLNPDLVVNTGDLVHIDNTELTPEILEALSGMKAADGVWSVWGNHDLGFYIRDTKAMPLDENLSELKAKLAAIDWPVLVDEAVYIRRGGDSILLAGVNYPDGRNLNGHNSALGGTDVGKTFARVSPDTYSVVLSHTPQLWREITDRGFGDLTLSGHVHSMQIKLGRPGRAWSPAKYLYNEWSGLYIENKQKKYCLYVNDGMGCVGYPMRVGATPELTIFRLNRCE